MIECVNMSAVRAWRIGESSCYDFGRAAFGTLEVELEGTGGEKVELAIGECLKDERLNRDPGGFRCFKKQWIVLRPGRQCCRFEIPPHQAPNPELPKRLSPVDFEITCFRYAEVTGAPKIHGIKRLTVFPEFDDNAAHFESSDDRLNRVWELCRYSMKATAAFGCFIDGERERLPYEGDAFINQLGYFCCQADYSIARRTLEHLLLHPTWPTEWQLLVPRLVVDWHLYSGENVPADWREVLEKRLLSEFMRPDGLLDREKFDVLDWPPPERDSYDSGPANLLPNCYLYDALLAMARLYGDDRYLTRAAALRKAIRDVMLKNGRFTDRPASSHTALHSAVFPVYFGLASPGELPGWRESIVEKGMACSVYGAQFLLDCCYSNGLAEYALERMTSSGLRSWLNMLEKGSTVTMEAWDDSFKPNQDWNHAWGAAPANIIPRRLCGIRPLEPGFRKFIVDPHPAGLAYFSLRHPTGHGPVELQGNADGMILSIPEDTCAIYAGIQYPCGTHRLPVPNPV